MEVIGDGNPNPKLTVFFMWKILVGDGNPFGGGGKRGGFFASKLTYLWFWFTMGFLVTPEVWFQRSCGGAGRWCDGPLYCLEFIAQRSEGGINRMPCGSFRVAAVCFYLRMRKNSTRVDHLSSTVKIDSNLIKPVFFWHFCNLRFQENPNIPPGAYPRHPQSSKCCRISEP